MITFLLNRSNVITQYCEFVRERANVDVSIRYIEDCPDIEDEIMVFLLINPPTEEQKEAIKQCRVTKVVNQVGYTTCDRLMMLKMIAPKRIVQKDKFGFPGKYIIRKEIGHANLGNPALLETVDDYINWYMDNPEPCILQYYVDTSVDGVFWSGRIFKVGTNLYPYSICATSDWNTNHYVEDIKEFHQGEENFWKLPGYKDEPKFWREVSGIFHHTGVDMGMLDFSIGHDGKVVPWEVSTALGFEFIGGYNPDLKFEDLDETSKGMIEHTVEVLETLDV